MPDRQAQRRDHRHAGAARMGEDLPLMRGLYLSLEFLDARNREG